MRRTSWFPGFLMVSLCLPVLTMAGCAAPPAPEPQRAFPADLVVTDMDGGNHDVGASLSRGEPVVLVFWQTWCRGCLDEMPGLTAAARRYQGSARFLGVVPGPDSTVDEREVRRVVFEQGIPYPTVRDRDLKLTQLLRVDGTPTVVVLGTGGAELWHGHGPPPRWEDCLGSSSAP